MEICVAELFKGTSSFCSSTVGESKLGHDANPPLVQVRSEVEDVPGKRKVIEGSGEFARIAKKLKSDSHTLQISRECSSLVGRLQLCNKRRHSWGGLSAGGDCLAFTDTTATICCSVSRGLDVSLVGKLVRVNSWSFIAVNEASGCTKLNPGQRAMQTLTRISASKEIALMGRSKFHRARHHGSEQEIFSRGESDTGIDICNGNGDAACGSGFLEIHTLELLEKQDMRVPTFPSLCVDPAAADIRNALFESPLMKKEEKRSRFTICGRLQSISPQFSLPCNYSDDRDDTKASSEVAASSKDNRQIFNRLSMIGFLVAIDYCNSCSCHYIDSWNMGMKKESRRARQLFGDGHLSLGANSEHGVEEDFDSRDSFHVFFSGSLAAWRPTLSGNIKHCVVISGLRRKLILTGMGKKYQSLLVATRTSLISPVVDSHHRNVREYGIPEKEDSEMARNERDSVNHHKCCTRNFERISEKSSSNHPRVISYVGFVTTILFQGTLVQLDKRVWLLLTHQGKSYFHGLRIGSMLALRDVHAVTINNPSEKAFDFSTFAKSFTQIHPKSVLRFCILDFFSHRELSTKVSWNLLRYRTYGNKEGSWHYFDVHSKLLAPDGILERPDYFKEFFNQQHISCSGGIAAFVSLNKVPPISNFSQDIETLLQGSRSKIRLSRTSSPTYFQRWLEIKRLLSSQEVSLARWQFAHSIINSQELGITLLGSLQVCQKSGQLQLMDGTGFVYAVVPDLLSSTHISKTYQVSSFTLMVKELTEDSNINGNRRCEIGRDSFISWSSLLTDSKAVLASSHASELLVHFYLRDATLVDTLSFCADMGESCIKSLKRRRLDQKQSKETGNMMELDLETISSWLEQRVYKLGSASSTTSHMKLLCDSVGCLNPPDSLFRVSCKVVAIDLLVFEYPSWMTFENRPLSASTSCPDLGLGDDWLFSLGVPLTLASFVVDDGSGLAHCWSLGDAAVSLLGLLKSSGQSEFPPNLLASVGEKYGRSDFLFTMMECVCFLVRRYGKIVLRSERPHGAAIDTSYPLQWCGRESPDFDDQAFMQAVVARACHKHPLVVTLGNVPPAVKPASESSNSPLECCRRFSNRTGFQRSRSQNEWPQLFATNVESTVPLSDVRAVSDEIASLLENRL